MMSPVSHRRSRLHHPTPLRCLASRHENTRIRTLLGVGPWVPTALPVAPPYGPVPAFPVGERGC